MRPVRLPVFLIVQHNTAFHALLYLCMLLFSLLVSLGSLEKEVVVGLAWHLLPNHNFLPLFPMFKTTQNYKTQRTEI